jgi:hypothetical protein
MNIKKTSLACRRGEEGPAPNPQVLLMIWPLGQQRQGGISLPNHSFQGGALLKMFLFFPRVPPAFKTSGAALVLPPLAKGGKEKGMALPGYDSRFLSASGDSRHFPLSRPIPYLFFPSRVFLPHFPKALTMAQLISHMILEHYLLTQKSSPGQALRVRHD